MNKRPAYSFVEVKQPKTTVPATECETCGAPIPQDAEHECRELGGDEHQMDELDEAKGVAA